MHEHDQDLIMALAEGSLDDTAAAAARTDIGGCAECSRDLELQQIALSALDDLPEIYLTAAESADLHTSLKRELKLSEPAPAPAARGFAWGRWMPVAGIAAVFLVVIIALPNMLGGSNDEGADTAAMDLTTSTAASQETTAAASAPRGAGTSGEDDALMDGAAEAEGMATATTEAMAEETTAADSTETTTSAQADAYGMLPVLGAVQDLDRDTLLDEMATQGDELKALSTEVREADAFVDGCLETNSTAEVAARLGLPEVSEPVLLGVVVDAETGEELLLVAYIPGDVEDTVFVTQRGFSCDIVRIVF